MSIGICTALAVKESAVATGDTMSFRMPNGPAIVIMQPIGGSTFTAGVLNVLVNGVIVTTFSLNGIAAFCFVLDPGSAGNLAALCTTNVANVGLTTPLCIPLQPGDLITLSHNSPGAAIALRQAAAGVVT